MKRWFSQIKKSDFVKNSATVVFGSSIAQIIPILTAPLLSRIYGPADYGVLGIYISISTLLGIVSTFQYSNAILLPKEDSEGLVLVKLCVKYTILTTCISAVVIAIFELLLVRFFTLGEIRIWIWFIPMSVFFTGLNLAFVSFANRLKLFRVVAANRIISAVSTLVFSISLGLVYKDGRGLVIGFLMGQFSNGIILTLRVLKKTDINFLTFLEWKETASVARQYINFPKLSLPTDFINNFTNQLPVFLISTYAGITTTGLYNICNRLLSLPQTFISNAIGDVFRQRASFDFNHHGTCRPIFTKMLRSLVLISITPFLILMIWGPDLFAFFLGEKWRHAGEFARIMGPIFLLRFINSPLSYVFYLLHKLQFDLIATIYLNVTSAIVLWFCLSHYSVEFSLIAFALNYCAVYLFMLHKSNEFSKIQNASHAAV